MMLNELILKCRAVSGMLSTGNIPVTLNGKPIEITDVSLEGENGNYHADIKTK